MPAYKVWWTTLVDGSLDIPVTNVAEGARVLGALAAYDNHLVAIGIRSKDACNAGGLLMVEDGEWVDWYDEETGVSDPNEFLGGDYA